MVVVTARRADAEAPREKGRGAGGPGGCLKRSEPAEGAIPGRLRETFGEAVRRSSQRKDRVIERINGEIKDGAVLVVR